MENFLPREAYGKYPKGFWLASGVLLGVFFGLGMGLYTMYLRGPLVGVCTGFMAVPFGLVMGVFYKLVVSSSNRRIVDSAFNDDPKVVRPAPTAEEFTHRLLCSCGLASKQPLGGFCYLSPKQVLFKAYKRHVGQEDIAIQIKNDTRIYLGPAPKSFIRSFYAKLGVHLCKQVVVLETVEGSYHFYMPDEEAVCEKLKSYLGL